MVNLFHGTINLVYTVKADFGFGLDRSLFCAVIQLQTLELTVRRLSEY